MEILDMKKFQRCLEEKLSANDAEGFQALMSEQIKAVESANIGEAEKENYLNEMLTIYNHLESSLTEQLENIKEKINQSFIQNEHRKNFKTYE